MDDGIGFCYWIQQLFQICLTLGFLERHKVTDEAFHSKIYWSAARATVVCSAGDCRLSARCGTLLLCGTAGQAELMRNSLSQAHRLAAFHPFGFMKWWHHTAMAFKIVNSHWRLWRECKVVSDEANGVRMMERSMECTLLASLNRQYTTFFYFNLTLRSKYLLHRVMANDTINLASLCSSCCQRAQLFLFYIRRQDSTSPTASFSSVAIPR